MKTENESYVFSDILPKVNGKSSLKSQPLFGETMYSGNLAEVNSLPPFSACLVDHSGRQFVCFNGHCSNHDSCFKNELLDKIFDFQALHFHPDDQALLNDHIFPDILKFMEFIPADELINYRFSFNHRYIRKDGSVSQFLQEGTLVICEDNFLPVLNLNVFAEIGDIKADDTMVLTIFYYSAKQGYQKVNSRVYGDNHNSRLSLRETEIVKLCLEGLSSKMIADKLNLSIHTVKNHKRNIMEKTVTHNITELIHLCQVNHWI